MEKNKLKFITEIASTHNGNINEVTKKIEEETRKSLFATSRSLFDKAINRQSRDKLKVVGGKK